MAHLYGDKGIYSQSIPTRKALPLRESCLLASFQMQVDWQSPSQPAPAPGLHREAGHSCSNYSTGLSSSCWLFTVFRVSKERHGKDEERTGEMENELRKQQWGREA